MDDLTLRANRLNMIEQYIVENEIVALDQLCNVFNISLNTVRRDLNELLKRGTIQKVYGGVKVVDKAHPIPKPIRHNMNLEGKAVIGELAAQLINDNDFIFIDSGSTTPNIIKHIANKKNITIISNSLLAMTEVSKYDSLNLIAIGGVYGAYTDSFLGISAIEAINNVVIKVSLMAATGVSIENGISNTTYYEAEIKRAVIKRSKNIVLMADQSKFGHDTPMPFCRLEDIQTVVTDRCPTQHYLQFFSDNSIRLLYPEQKGDHQQQTNETSGDV